MIGLPSSSKDVISVPGFARCGAAWPNDPPSSTRKIGPSWPEIPFSFMPLMGLPSPSKTGRPPKLPSATLSDEINCPFSVKAISNRLRNPSAKIEIGASAGKIAWFKPSLPPNGPARSRPSEFSRKPAAKASASERPSGALGVRTSSNVGKS